MDESALTNLETDEKLSHIVADIYRNGNLLKTMILGKYYDREVKEQILQSDQISLTKDERAEVRVMIDRYLECESKIQELIASAGISSEELELLDSVSRRLKTQLSMDEIKELQEAYKKLVLVANELSEYNDLFGKTNE